MKKSILKITFVILAVMMVLAIGQTVVKAAEVEKIIYEDKDGNSLIYYKDYIGKAFRFVITENETEPEIVTSKSSIEDGSEDKLNVAYVYAGAPLKDGKGYMWIIDDTDAFVVKADPIDLSTALNDDIIQSVNNEIIAVDTTQKYESTKVEDGVTKNVSLGKVVIKDQEVEYEYQLVKVEEGSKEARLFELAEQLEVEAKGVYEKLALNKEYYDLYNELKPSTGWTAVEKDGILQPENAEKGDKYLVWLRSTSGTALLEDVKFFISDYEYTPEYKNEDKVIVEVVKTPVTYDSIALFIVLAGIIIAIVVVAILRKKSNKENK